MVSNLKLYVGRKLIESLKRPPNITPIDLKSLMQVGVHKSKKHFEMSIPLSSLQNQLGISGPQELLKIEPDDIISNISLNTRPTNRIIFEINKNIFMREVVSNCIKPDAETYPKTIVVEYSSPNIAKPFHVGHLRSTIIGNFISNLHIYLGDKVTRLNYLGDWGTQFGFIKVGVDKMNYSNEDIQKDPIKRLYESYVYANKLAEKDPEIAKMARMEFNKLENGLAELDYWKTFLNYTVDELQLIYSRLGVTFDEYSYESMYNSKSIKNLLDRLEKHDFFKKHADNRLTIDVGDQEHTLIKSDGSTLYLTRDIAAAMDRHNKYEPDLMYYVVENGQNDHFVTLKSTLHSMHMHWYNSIRHIKFGRVRGMSTRKGTVVFLKDILDETRELILQKQIESPNTKIPITPEVADVVGASCVIINDLKQKRQRDYEFSWDKVLQVQGDSGIKLQYTHCRLHSLEINCGTLPAHQSIPELLDQPEIIMLVKDLARFQDVLQAAKEQLEACILVTYLFQLCHSINKALKALRVKNQEANVASQRLLVFITARKVLGEGMSILGLKPLKQM